MKKILLSITTLIISTSAFAGVGIGYQFHKNMKFVSDNGKIYRLVSIKDKKDVQKKQECHKK